MGREYYTLGSTPCGEECAQVGSDNYHARMNRETQAYIGQLQRLFPTLPDGVYFAKKGFAHDYGTYHEVVVFFDDNDEAACEAASKVESELPEFWDEAAKLVLNPLSEQLAADLEQGKKSTYLANVMTFGAVLQHKRLR